MTSDTASPPAPPRLQLVKPGDENARPPQTPLAPRYLRFSDLKARGIVNNRTTLARWIADFGFPHGVALGPKIRAYREDEVEHWIATNAGRRPPE